MSQAGAFGGQVLDLTVILNSVGFEKPPHAHLSVNLWFKSQIFFLSICKARNGCAAWSGRTWCAPFQQYLPPSLVQPLTKAHTWSRQV